MKRASETSLADIEAKRLERDSTLDRAAYADSILAKMSYGTYRTRANLLSWLKEARKVTGFELSTLKSMKLVTDAQINGKLGAEAKALRKSNKEMFDSLLLLPCSTLKSQLDIMSASRIQSRYGRRIDDAEIGVPIKLKTEREVNVGTRPQLAGWLRSKQNRANREAVAPVRDQINGKRTERLKARAPIAPPVKRDPKTLKVIGRPKRPQARRRATKFVGKTANDYAASIRGFGEYIDTGLRVRSECMQAIERRTKTSQKMSNLD